MNHRLPALLFLASAFLSSAQTSPTGKTAAIMIEHFTLTDHRTYDGIWDGGKSVIHVVQGTNHIANLPIAADEIATRQLLRDGTNVKLLSDLEVTGRVLKLNKKNYEAAVQRANKAKAVRANLHQTYHGQNLPQKQYDAVMLQYQAADAEVTASDQAVNAASKGLDKAVDAYKKAGGQPALVDIDELPR